MNFDLTKPITINGETFEPSDFYQRKLLVNGVQPTNYENYVFLDILANHKNTKTTQTGDKAGGTAQTTYRYQDLSDLPKFNEHAYPYYLDVVMTDTVDKKGNSIPVILFADFANVQEMELVPRKKQAPTAQPTPTAKV